MFNLREERGTGKFGSANSAKEPVPSRYSKAMNFSKILIRLPNSSSWTPST
jgi:hypothetical protein